MEPGLVVTKKGGGAKKASYYALKIGNRVGRLRPPGWGSKKCNPQFVELWIICMHFFKFGP